MGSKMVTSANTWREFRKEDGLYTEYNTVRLPRTAAVQYCSQGSQGSITVYVIESSKMKVQPYQIALELVRSGSRYMGIGDSGLSFEQDPDLLPYSSQNGTGY
ncbi:hypothetical protein P7K49_031097 [Saguinus oedipus]|uniref:Uncharacterized protein n=1 Tax=Saguinus oedipus TaxID=9490 RepID=A0ABQ9U416_SAGOE|nr:hypothetical protein P7K49_031097 [Saguinus oedipus]